MTTKNVIPKHRIPLLAVGILTLLAAMWAGLLRLGWSFPPIQATWPAQHGLLMVSGFLGSLISLERAVALRKRWTYGAPVVTALGALLILTGVPGLLGPSLIVLGSVWLLLIYALILQMLPSLFNVIMAIGGLFWAVGNVLWLLAYPPALASLWWQGFLVLTIVGERLELSRVLRLTSRVQSLLIAAIGMYILGIVGTHLSPDIGIRIVGTGMLALTLWLLRYDVATRTVRLDALPRFVAISLLAGYIWLGVGGVIALVAGYTSGGFLYDAFLHAVYLGFVFSMIFGHAPIIFPAVLNLPIHYTPRFYLHLALLHVSLILRIGGDLTALLSLRKWGGLINVIAILIFLGNTVASILRQRRRKHETR